MPIAATLVAVLAQVPTTVPGSGPPISPPPQEWILGGVFRLKQEQFLRWQPVLSLRTGWDTALRVVWLVELSPMAPSRPALERFALALESTPTSGAPREIPIVRPRLQYQPASSQTRVGVELPVAPMYSPGLSSSWQVFRPRLFVSGRF